MSEVKVFHWDSDDVSFFGYGSMESQPTRTSISLRLASDYDALAAQRDEGLAREALMRLGYEQCKQRLAEAEKAHPANWTDKQVLEFLGVALRNVDIVGTVMLHEIRQGFQFMAGQPITQTGFASPDCADEEKE